MKKLLLIVSFFVFIFFCYTINMATSDTGKEQVNTYDGKLRIEYANNRIIVADDLVNRLLIGQTPEGDIKMRLSQPTYDVLTATDDQLIWDSDRNAFKIVYKGTGRVYGIDNSAGGLWTSGTADNTSHFYYNHGLGYAPSVISYGDFNYGGTIKRFPLPNGVDFNGVMGYPFLGYVQVLSTESQIQVTFITCPGVNESANFVDFTFYLVRETAN